MRPLLLAPAALLLLTGCGTSVTAGVGDSVTRDDMLGTWELVDGSVDGRAVPQPQGALPTLVLDGEQASGQAFCNSFFADYRLDRGALSLSTLSVTEMACEPASVMAADHAYLTALDAADERAVLSDGRLVLSGEGAQLRFRRLPQAPQEELVGTEWLLTALLRGQTVSSVAGAPVLRLAEDGTFHASTGCRHLSGTWTRHGDKVLLPTLSAEGDCGHKLRDQDDHVVRVLGDGFEAREESGTLTVEDPDGSGLVYQASPSGRPEHPEP